MWKTEKYNPLQPPGRNNHRQRKCAPVCLLNFAGTLALRQAAGTPFEKFILAACCPRALEEIRHKAECSFVRTGNVCPASLSVLALHGRQTLPQFWLEGFFVHVVSPWPFLKLNTQLWHLVAPNKLIMEFWRLEKGLCWQGLILSCVLPGLQKLTSACAEQGLTCVAAKCWESVSNTYFLILVCCEFSFWWLGKKEGWWFRVLISTCHSSACSENGLCMRKQMLAY